MAIPKRRIPPPLLLPPGPGSKLSARSTFWNTSKPIGLCQHTSPRPHNWLIITYFPGTWSLERTLKGASRTSPFGLTRGCTVVLSHSPFPLLEPTFEMDCILILRPSHHPAPMTRHHIFLVPPPVPSQMDLFSIGNQTPIYMHLALVFTNYFEGQILPSIPPDLDTKIVKPQNPQIYSINSTCYGNYLTAQTPASVYYAPCTTT